MMTLKAAQQFHCQTLIEVISHIKHTPGLSVCFEYPHVDIFITRRVGVVKG